MTIQKEAATFEEQLQEVLDEIETADFDGLFNLCQQFAVTEHFAGLTNDYNFHYRTRLLQSMVYRRMKEMVK